MPTEEKIVIRAVNKPNNEKAGAILEWFCQVFDLGDNEDGLEPTMFREIVVASFSGEGVTSKDLNKKFDTPRSTVIYHLNRFIYSGLVIRRGRRYYLRSEDMASTIEELHDDMNREFNRLLQFAEKLDETMESNNYGRKRRARIQSRRPSRE
ncbi:MAG: helix-turn-helix transcriptional regulator [Candidatus Micrarchaeota archaeon]|nr:helix-turn-helix transcriptional regulator [Candidatus Micrarchaeota archaeon]